jgi:hypothetical protein
MGHKAGMVRMGDMDHKANMGRTGDMVRTGDMDLTGGHVVNIAGVIGLTVLLNKKTNNKVFLFYDDHENIKYCPSSQQFISDMLNTLLSTNDAYVHHNSQVPDAEAKGGGIGCKYMLILEEPFIDNHSDVGVLWDDVKHLCLFRDFYSKIIKKCSKENVCNGFPVDMRIALLEFSLYMSDYSSITITLNESFNKIAFLFDLDTKVANISALEGAETVLAFLKNVFSNYTHTYHYRQLKKKIEAFYNKFIRSNGNMRVCDFADSKSIDGMDMFFVCGYPFTDKEILNFFDELDKILSAIMEFYMIILINIFKEKHKIVYAGYYHCKNVKHILTSYYDYEQIYNTGITDNVETTENVCSCINVPATLFN